MVIKDQKKRDGGYYAIKGFEFQIDKSILEIFNSPDENTEVAIEQIQDIKSDNFVMQIKYKEAQDFTPSKIKEPVIQLIHESLKNESQKTYYLYCFFRNKSAGAEKIDLKFLDKLLGDSSKEFNQQQKNNFINNFILDFSDSFQNQFSQIISKLIGNNFASNEDEAIFYYSHIAHFLRKLVIRKTNPSERFCTKKQIFDYIKSGKNLIFNSAFKEYKGEKAYLEFVKTKFRKIKKNQDNFIFLGSVIADNSVSLEKLITDTTEGYYKNAPHDIRPLTFIIPNEKTHDVKIHLIDRRILFNDGYEHIKFHDSLFFDKPIINKKKIGNGRATESLDRTSFKLRVLSIKKFQEIENHIIKPEMIYYFDTETFDIFDNISFIKIDKLNTKQIAELII